MRPVVFVLLLAAAAATALAAAAAAVPSAFGGAPNAIQLENAKAGTSSWYIAAPAQDQIAGYFGRVSYLPGNNARLYVDSGGDAFSYTVYRMGFYAGLGGREVASGDTANTAQPVPVVSDDRDGGAKLLTTGWHPSATIPLGADWVSGYYLVKLHDDANGGESYANFVLRSPDPAPIVVVLSTNTWQAYNEWHGLSLYRDLRVTPPITSEWSVPHRVSFMRPYSEGYGASKFFLYDRPLVEWAEAHGYPISYATDEDLRRARVAGPQTRLVIFSGHSEYHSISDRRETLRLTQAGVSEAFFGGNDWIWQARFDDRQHTMTVWREKSLDPEPDPKLKTTRWKWIGLPQSLVTGTMDTHGTQSGQQEVFDASGWEWRGAGVSADAELGPLEGGEFDGITGYPRVTVLAATPFTKGNQAMTLWQKHSAFVFAAGQTGFNWYLDYPGVTPASWISPEYPQATQQSMQIQTLAENLIARATGGTCAGCPANRHIKGS